MKYAFISEKNLILEAQSVDSCLCILILLNILILHPIFINWSVSLLLHKASFYKTKVTENVDECRWLHTQTWTWGTLVLEFLESLPFIFFRLEPGSTWQREWKCTSKFNTDTYRVGIRNSASARKYFLNKLLCLY